MSETEAPKTLTEFVEKEAKEMPSAKLENIIERLKDLHTAPQGSCINCGEEFSIENVFTPAGWKETKISQLCEKCFDNITGE